MECFPFSDLRIFSLSIPLCEWLTSTPFLLLVYYLYIFVQKKGKNGVKKRGSVYADLDFDILHQSNTRLFIIYIYNK